VVPAGAQPVPGLWQYRLYRALIAANLRVQALRALVGSAAVGSVAAAAMALDAGG
jgi:hypothetical protein